MIKLARKSRWWSRCNRRGRSNCWGRGRRCEPIAWGGSSVVHKVAGLICIKSCGLAFQRMAFSHILTGRQHYYGIITIGERIDNLPSRVNKREMVAGVA